MWAQEMKNLAAEIRTLHRDTTASINRIKGATRDILKEADDYMKRVAGELREMARDLKNFLAKSEEGRKKDFNALIGEIRARIKEIKGNMKELLAKSEEKRILDFKALMKDISDDIAGIKDRVEEIKKETKGTIKDYSEERKEAAGYWARLRGKEEAPVVEEAPAPKVKKKKK